jgi:predicted Rossmann fold nucleotide-binding protein DprA/Smf involved in DNA uptake
MSIYGKKVIEKLFDYAVDYDVVTISGMAEGVDQLSHQCSINQNIPTIAVL